VAVEGEGLIASPRLSRVHGVGQPKLDVRLAVDADPSSLDIDFMQQIQREVDIDALHLAAGPAGVSQVEML